MFKFFSKKKDTGPQSQGNLEIEYNSFLNAHLDNIEGLDKKAQAYIDEADYANPMTWMDALAICDVALKNNRLTETIYKLYDQVYSLAWNKHVSMDFDEADYDYWFKLNDNINNSFIQAGYNQAYAEQADLYSNARRPYRDYAKMRDFFEKGIALEDPASLGDYGYGIYYGIPGYGDQDKEKGMEMILKSKEAGYKLCDLLLLHIEFSENKDDDVLLKHIEEYIEKAPENRKAYYILSDYYSRLGNQEKAIEAMKKGVVLNDHYCQYLYGMAILKKQVEDVELSEGIRLLEEAFSYDIIYAGNFLGQYYYYANDENSSVEKAIEWHKKAVRYYSSDSAYELAVIYLYNNEYKNFDKANEYLDIAIAENNHRALSEKAYLLLEYLAPEERNPAEAKRLLEKAMEMGNDYAPYRLGLGFERGEFGDKGEPDYKKILGLYELAAERGSVSGMDLAGHYYRLDIAGEDDRNGEKAVEYFNKAIERNSNYSRVELALCYEIGRGIEKDYTKAFELYKHAAEQGYPYANIKMGYYLEDGLVGEEDFTAAFENFKIAADAGMPEGFYNVGRYYKYGIGLPENPELAIENLNKSAEEDYGQALIEMALINEKGYGGVEHNPEQAMQLMTRAAEQGYPYAQYKLGYYYYYGLTEQDIEKGLEWFNRAYGQGYPYAALMLGDYYLYNHGNEGEYSKAFDYYKYAESQDCISEGLGICYEYGLGVDENNTEAFKYYSLAAERGYTAAKYRLGLCYKYGTGTTENPEQAFYWFSQAAEDEHTSSIYEAAMMILDGIGTEKNEQRAVEMLIPIAEEDHDDAQFELGNCYLTGRGVPEDEVQAMIWYQRAADNGHEQAQKITGKRERRRR